MTPRLFVRHCSARSSDCQSLDLDASLLSLTSPSLRDAQHLFELHTKFSGGGWKISGRAPRQKLPGFLLLTGALRPDAALAPPLLERLTTYYYAYQRISTIDRGAAEGTDEREPGPVAHESVSFH